MPSVNCYLPHKDKGVYTPYSEGSMFRQESQMELVVEQNLVFQLQWLIAGNLGPMPEEFYPSPDMIEFHWNLSSNHTLQSNALYNQKVQQTQHTLPSASLGRLVDYLAQGWKSPQPFLRVPRCLQHSWVEGCEASHQRHRLGNEGHRRVVVNHRHWLRQPFQSPT